MYLFNCYEFLRPYKLYINLIDEICAKKLYEY